MEDEYRNISPLYMQRLKGRMENALWNLFEESKYRQVEEYVRRWHEDDGSFWENFRIFGKDGHIDLGRTLAGMPNDIFIGAGSPDVAFPDTDFPALVTTWSFLCRLSGSLLRWFCMAWLIRLILRLPASGGQTARRRLMYHLGSSFTC